MNRFKDAIVVAFALFSFAFICVLMAAYIRIVGVTVDNVALGILVAISSAIPSYYLIKEYVNKEEA